VESENCFHKVNEYPTIKGIPYSHSQTNVGSLMHSLIDVCLTTWMQDSLDN